MIEKADKLDKVENVTRNVDMIVAAIVYVCMKDILCLTKTLKL